MADFSFAGPNEGAEYPDEVVTDEYEEFGKTRLFVGWNGNGYVEDTCWIVADLDMVCKLSSWE